MTSPIPRARTFQDLIVWRKAHEFALSVYALTSEFPKQEIYGLSSQLRRAAVAVPANVAEGFRRQGQAGTVRFMNVAQSSLEECRYYLILARDLGYQETDQQRVLLEEVSRHLNSDSKAIQVGGACDSDS